MTSKNVPEVSGAEWIAELSGGDLTLAQRAALVDWLRDSPANVRMLLEHTLIDQDLRGLTLPQQQLEDWVSQARVAGDGVRSFREIEVTAPDMNGAQRRSSFLTVPWAIAACLILAIAVALSSYGWKVDRYTTRRGEMRVMALEDGSLVSLNTDSAIKVHMTAARREIQLLKGEALFRVAKDKTRPFEVMTEGLSIKAIGTQFNVRLASDRDAVVSVLEGRVLISSATPQPMTLDRGDEVRVDIGGDRVPRKVVKPASDDAALTRVQAWTLGRLEFDQAPLADVLEEFRRYQDLQVRMESPQLAGMQLTGSFDSHDPQSFMDYLATLPGVRIENTGRTFVIRSR